MSAGVTTQVLTLLPIQAGLAAGVGLAIREKSDHGWVTLLALVLVALAVLCGVYALSRVHHKTLWEEGTDKARHALVLDEAKRVYDKGRWTRGGVWVTLLAAVAVASANLLAFDV